MTSSRSALSDVASPGTCTQSGNAVGNGVAPSRTGREVWLALTQAFQGFHSVHPGIWISKTTTSGSAYRLYPASQPFATFGFPSPGGEVLIQAARAKTDSSSTTRTRGAPSGRIKLDSVVLTSRSHNFRGNSDILRRPSIARPRVRNPHIPNRRPREDL